MADGHSDQDVQKPTDTESNILQCEDKCTRAGVLCSIQLLQNGGWQVWRSSRWWEPDATELPGPDVQVQVE